MVKTAPEKRAKVTEGIRVEGGQKKRNKKIGRREMRTGPLTYFLSAM